MQSDKQSGRNGSTVIDKAHSAVDTFSGSASEQARKLAFVGFGLIALFGGLNDASFSFPVDLPPRLIWAGLFFALTLAFDLLQYIYGASAYFMWARRQESLRESDAAWVEPSAFPSAINRPTWALFSLKIVTVGIGWTLLLTHLATSLN